MLNVIGLKKIKTQKINDEKSHTSKTLVKSMLAEVLKNKILF